MPSVLSRLHTPPLALRNVLHGGRRSLAAVSGVAFSLTMVLLQLGFLEAVKITASNNYEQLDFNIVLLSPRYEQFYATGLFPRERLTQALGVEGVVSAAPLHAAFELWRCPPYPLGGSEGEADTGDDLAAGPLTRWLMGNSVSRPLQRRQLYVLGIDLDRNPFYEPIRGRIEANTPLLRLSNRILLNEQSHPDFGWELRDRYHDWELGTKAVTIVGGFPMLRGFAADSTVICGERNFAALCGVPNQYVSIGLLNVSPALLEFAKAELRRVLPPDVEAFTRSEILAREKDHWVNQTSTGQLFAFGVMVAMIVAAVVVYQVLSGDVREHLPEYATLKAMGYSQLSLSRVIVAQSLIYMMTSYVVAVLLSIVVYWATQELAGIPMRLTLENLGITLLLAIVVGLLSGLLSLGKLRAAQPVELF